MLPGCSLNSANTKFSKSVTNQYIGVNDMFLGVRQDIWIIMLLCVLIVFLYSVIGDLAAAKKNSERASRFQPMKYAAIALCAVIAVVATVISKHEVYIGSPMLALIIGIVIVNLIPDEKFSKSFQAGTSYAGKKYLNLGIIALGATLAFTDIFSAVYALPLVLFNMILAFSMANLVGRKVLKVSPNTCTLVGGGTCICGGTAIAALSPIIKAKEEETAYAMTSIFLFDLLACLSYPYLAMNLGFSETQFGFLAGTAINDTSSVVAAQETFSGLMNITGYALPASIKVVRTSMIIVLALIFSLITIRHDAVSDSGSFGSVGRVVWKAFPKFILFFLAAVALNTVLANAAADEVLYTDYFSPFFANGYKFFVTVALAGVGFKIKFKELFTKGLKPIALGGVTWVSLFLVSFIFSNFFVN